MRVVTISLAALFLLLSFSCTAAAQQKPATCADWFAVQSWSGTYTYTGSGSSTLSNGDAASFSENVRIDFTMAKGSSPCDVNGSFGSGEGIWGWDAQGVQATYHVSAHDVFQSQQRDQNGNRCTVTTNFDIDNGTANFTDAQINMNFNSATAGTFSISAAQTADNVPTKFSGCGSSSTSTDSVTWGPPGFPPKNIPLPSVIGPLVGSTTISGAGFFGAQGTWTVTWNLTPHINWDVLLITSPDYATWRPQAGRSEKDVSAGVLGVNVYIADKDTGQSATNISVDGWTVELKNVSHEPGVALNWPAKANLAFPAPADLDFKDLNDAIFPNVKVSADGLTLQATPDPGTDNQLAFFMNSRDWGAWGTLNITTTIAGQTIKAHFAGDKTTDILLPKRQPGSLIADNWKIDQGLPLDTPDLDDSENDPVGDGNKGDGLTLYEEYRGFYMGCSRSNGYPVQESSNPGAACKHVEGDAKRKDLFVASELSAEESLGIKKFKEETKLNVHYKGLSKDEIGTDHLINFNFGAGSHLQNGLTKGQHALYVRWDASRGSSVALGGPGVPRKIDTVLLAGGDDSLSEKPPGSNEGNNYFTATVAHELSHAVDVWHHGENGSRTVFWYADDAGQVWETASVDALQHPVTGTGVAIKVFPEDKDPRTTTPTSAWTLGLLENCAAMNNTCPPNSTGLNVNLGNRVCGSTVKLHGQFSGDQECYMRYDAAEAYIPNGFSNVRYFRVEEITGQHLTDTVTGTEVNDANHSTGLGPLSRYGDADTAHQRGNCLSQVNVNDLTDPPARDVPSSCTAN